MAEKIFALGKKYGTVFFSSSALRFAAEHEGKKDALCVCTTGGGGNLPEYIIHQAEMIVRLMGVGATSVTAEKLCDKVAIIKGGKIIKVGTMEEVKGDESLEEVFLDLEKEDAESLT